MLSKKRELKEFGIDGKEAFTLLRDIIAQEEGIYKNDAKGVFALIFFDLTSTRKRTINDRHGFENKAREIIKKSKEKINNGDYQEVAKEILKLFRDEAKSTPRLYLENNSIIILMSLSVISIVVPVILKFT